MTPVVYFFGCKSHGHYMYGPNSMLYVDLETPWGKYPDGSLCPEGPQEQGVAQLHHKDGWTAIGMWDRTGDSRDNSNSNFIAKGIFSFEQMCKMAGEQHPRIWKRIGTVRKSEESTIPSNF